MTQTQSINDAVAAELRAAAARKGVHGNALGQQLNEATGNAFVGPSWARRRLNGATDVSVEDLVLICDALGVYPLDVLAQALTHAGHPTTAGT